MKRKDASCGEPASKQVHKEATLPEDLAERFLAIMLERLRKKQHAVRCQAAVIAEARTNVEVNAEL